MLVVAALLKMSSRNIILAEKFIIDRRTNHSGPHERLEKLLQVAVGARKPRCEKIEEEEEKHEEQLPEKV